MKGFVFHIIFSIFIFHSAEYYSQNFSDSLKFKTISTEVKAGTSVISFGNRNNYALSYVYPKINYNLSPRFQLSVGMLITQSNLFYNPEMNQSGNIRNFLVLSGGYKLNDRCMIYGKTLFETAVVNFNNQINTARAYSLGFDYNITDKLNFGAEFEFSNYNNPLYNDPFQPAGMFINNY